jgi:hypothetical protein
MLHKGVYSIKGDGRNRVSKISSRLGLEIVRGCSRMFRDCL